MEGVTDPVEAVVEPETIVNGEIPVSLLKSVSIMHLEDRFEQIMRIDTHALLNTIRDLEQKLSDHQRQDKMPAWALALETRLEQLEKFQSSDPKLPAHQSQSSQDAAPSRKESMKSGQSAVPEIVAEEAFSVDSAAPEAEVIVSPEKNKTLSLATLTIEDRILHRIRAEFETKLGNTQLHFEGMISSSSLEMERLHKLLLIRPTTSELQQVILGLQQAEQRSQQRIQEAKEAMLSSIRDSVSQEMIGFLTDLKHSRNAGEEGIRLISKQVSEFSAQVSELREGAQNSFTSLEVNLSAVTDSVNSQAIDMENTKAKLADETARMTQAIAVVRQEMKDTIEALHYHNSKTEEALRVMNDRMQAESRRNERDVRALDDKFTLLERNMIDLEATFGQFTHSYHSDQDEFKAWQALTDDLQATQTADIDSMTLKLDTFLAKDLPGQLSRHTEQLTKQGFEISEVRTLLNSTINTDLKNMAMKIAVLQEQVTITLPNAMTEHTQRMDRLQDAISINNAQIVSLNDRSQHIEETVDTLIPLKEKVNFLSDAKNLHDNEITQLKEGFTGCVDANSEFARRLEEMEETMENLDESINARMNRIRDTLMDTLLEKQSETNQAVRNVRENLEVMSMAGEAGSNPSPPQTSSSQQQQQAPGKLNRVNSSMMKNSNYSERETSPPVLRGSMQIAQVAQLKKMGSYRRPSMAGVTVQGTNIDSSSSIGKPGQQPALVRIPSTTSLDSDSGSTGGQPTGHLSRGASNKRMSGGGGDMPAMLNKAPSMKRPNMGLASVTEGNREGHLSNHSSMVQLPVIQNTNAMASFLQQSSSSQSSQPQQQQQQQMGMMIQPGSNVAAQLPFLQSMGNQQQQVHQAQQPQAIVQQGMHLQQQYPSLYPGGISPLQQQLDRQQQQQNSNNSDYQILPHVHITQDHGSADTIFQPDPSHHHQQQSQAQQQHLLPMMAPQQALQQQTNYNVNSLMNRPSAALMNTTHAPSNRAEALSMEYNALLHPDGHDGSVYVHFNEAQFLADLCLNYEEISLKRKRVTNVPPMLCASIAQVAHDLAEFMANAADFEMVESSLAAINAPLAVEDVKYDENYVVNARQRKLDEYLSAVNALVMAHVPQAGMVRSDARGLFLALVKKALDMFMTKHNQVLVVGNSRLGRVKIPSCIACDRPLLERVRLDTFTAPQSAGSQHQMGGGSFYDHGDIDDGNGGGGSMVFAGGEDGFHRGSGDQQPLTSASMKMPGKGLIGRGLLQPRPQTMATGNRGAYTLKAGFKMPVSSSRPNSSMVSGSQSFGN